jgi:hypothetical protein
MRWEAWNQAPVAAVGPGNPFREVVMRVPTIGPGADAGHDARRRRRTLLALALASAPLVASPLAAQRRGGDGYRFQAPRGTLTLRLGVAQPSAASGLFDFVRDELTLGTGAFTGVNVGADFAVPVTSRLALQFGAGTQQRSVGSEYRDFVGTDDLPITQRTAFQRTPLTVGVQWHLVPTGQQVGRLAWVPARLAPYLSAGGGMMHFRFRQEGEFVDAQSYDVFRSTMNTQGWAPVGFLAAGTTLSLTPGLALALELRREQARGSTAGPFRDFRHIDLAGTSATVGLTFRY